MKKLHQLGICLFLLTGAIPVQAADDAAQLTDMLNEFLAGASINDPAAHERFWADDLIYTTSGGKRVSKADIMSDLTSPSESTGDEPETVYTAEDIRIQQYGDTAIVAFRLVGTPRGDAAAPPQVQEYFNTGTFLRRDGVWQVVAWQATKIPAAG